MTVVTIHFVAGAPVQLEEGETWSTIDGWLYVFGAGVVPRRRAYPAHMVRMVVETDGPPSVTVLPPPEDR
jgi:hypothetical protein